MRFREKMILIIMGLLILAVFLEALPTIYPEFDGRINNEIESNANDPVSYTHLTLPTIYSV